MDSYIGLGSKEGIWLNFTVTLSGNGLYRMEGDKSLYTTPSGTDSMGHGARPHFKKRLGTGAP